MAKLLREIVSLRNSYQNSIKESTGMPKVNMYSTKRFGHGQRMTTTLSGKHVGRTTFSTSHGERGNRMTSAMRSGSNRFMNTKSSGGLTIKQIFSPWRKIKPTQPSDLNAKSDDIPGVQFNFSGPKQEPEREQSSNQDQNSNPDYQQPYAKKRRPGLARSILSGAFSGIVKGAARGFSR